MSGLKDRVLALIGRRRKGPGVAGWIRVDADHVVRGWAVDGAEPDRRVQVDIRVDGEVVGRATADRLDPKLVELGHGDGRHAFECLIPARFRDGAPHAFEAVETRSGYRLMSKADSFTAPRPAEAPGLTIERVDENLGVTGALRGGQYPPDVQLELWSDGARLPAGPTTWRWRGGVAEFHLAWPEGALYALGSDAVLAAPGMHEAGEGAARFASVLRLAPGLAAGGFKVVLQGRLELDRSVPVTVEVIGEDGGVIAQAQLEHGAASLPVPSALHERARLQIRGKGGPIRLLERPLELPVGALIRNDNFGFWSGAAPADWSVPDEVTSARGFYAFPPSFGLPLVRGGDFVRLQAGGGQLLLSQDIAAWASIPGLDLRLGLVARASSPLSLRLDLVGPGGEAVHSLTLDLAEAWTWTSAGHTAVLDAAPISRAQLSLTETATAGTIVEIAAVTVGGAARTIDAGAGERAWGLPENLVDNGDLADWPRGLALQIGAGRSECAAGWFVQNHKGAAPVGVMAVTSGARLGMAVAAEKVADYCRLEARLHPEALRAGPRLRVTFEAAIPADAPAAFQARRPHSVIERLFLLRRGLKPGASGSALGAEVLAIVSRRIAVGREPQAFSFDIELGEAKASQLESAELFLTFDFNDPFAILLRDVRVTAPPLEAARSPLLELEDPAITAQAATLKGLGAWLSPVVATPGVRFEAETAEAGPPLRWSPLPQGSATVEVVVCVHDAADETLACLQSLLASSSVLHTVRIIDDGSGADTRNRLLEFIAEKPWMRMISSTDNRGYTASANLGVRGSAADWLVLLNSDTVVTPGWIEGLLDCAASDPAIAFVGPVSNAASYQSVPELKDRQGRWKINALPPGWLPARMAAFVATQADKGFPQVPLLNGFCTMIRRDAFLALGGFNEAAFPQGYGEENDLCVRAVAAGYRLAVADHVYVFHSKSASFGSARRAELQKAAGKALADLYPDADFGALGDRVREAAPLVNLRAKVRALYEAQG